MEGPFPSREVAGREGTGGMAPGTRCRLFGASPSWVVGGGHTRCCCGCDVVLGAPEALDTEGAAALPLIA